MLSSPPQFSCAPAVLKGAPHFAEPAHITPGGGQESRVPSSCQLSPGLDLGVSLGSCLPRGCGTRALAAECGGAGAEPRAQPAGLDTFLQLLREAKSQGSTCCFTYSCQRGENRLNPAAELPSLAPAGFCPALYRSSKKQRQLLPVQPALPSQSFWTPALRCMSTEMI